MAEISFIRKDDKWTVLLDGKNITNELSGFLIESNRRWPSSPPEITLHFKPQSDVDFQADEAEVVEVRHEHEWVELTDFSDHEKGERHYVCNGCPQRRIEREVSR